MPGEKLPCAESRCRESTGNLLQIAVMHTYAVFTMKKLDETAVGHRNGSLGTLTVGKSKIGSVVNGPLDFSSLCVWNNVTSQLWKVRMTRFNAPRNGEKVQALGSTVTGTENKPSRPHPSLVLHPTLRETLYQDAPPSPPAPSNHDMQTRAATKRNAANASATPMRHPHSSATTFPSSAPTSRANEKRNYNAQACTPDRIPRSLRDSPPPSLRLQSPFHPGPLASTSSSSSSSSSSLTTTETPRVVYPTPAPKKSLTLATPSPSLKPEDLLSVVRAKQEKQGYVDRVTPVPVSEVGHNPMMNGPPAAPRRPEEGRERGRGRGRGGKVNLKDEKKACLETLLEDEDVCDCEEEGEHHCSIDGGKYRLRFEELESELEMGRVERPVESCPTSTGYGSEPGRKTLKRRWTLGN
ncbi:hypothetical protein K435DRAFT_833758 [Dendrothele bispora CBS 962.96]|uniref:Uncharacterized protein n=1 Tax=Dendrothele bispora (strain CBS 962.96) TaxID=1314807 RepID=A0A4S8MX35_DENBC|nr:hypothetical protein K435DRAFT_833758 [Dendrothele bispora CBS 962.96]